jgi:hypothetical protein
LIDDDDKTEITDWSTRFDFSDNVHQSESIADLPGKGASWLKKVVQQLSGADEKWGLRCEFCGQYESSDTRIQRHGIRLVPICSQCISFDR